ncbi:MAG: GNAT family N-acetyltransferase [Bacteroidota bacterium]
MKIQEVNTPKLFEEFINVHRIIYKGNNDWICPLDKDIKKVFDEHENIHFKTGKAKQWLLKNEQGQAIGRIAAFYDTTQFKGNEHNGGIGFYECIDDLNASKLMFETAINWLKYQGINVVNGPINFGEKNAFWGLMVAGFKNPSYKENFNWAYYEKQFLEFGFVQHTEQTTSEITYANFDMIRFKKLSERVMQNSEYSFEHFKMNELERFGLDFVEIYNKAWSHREDFVPMTKERIMAEMLELKPIIMEEAIWFAYANKKPIGFYVSVMDVNQIFKELNGKFNWWAKLKFVYYKTFGQVNRIRGEVFGVIPEYQEKGIETGMIMSLYNSITNKYSHINTSELGWIGDFNPKMHGLFEKLGAKTTKVHRTYKFKIADH